MSHGCVKVVWSGVGGICGVGLVWSVLSVGEVLWFGVGCGGGKMMEAGFNAEDGVGGKGYGHEGADS